MRLLAFITILSLLLAACNANEEHVQKVQEQLDHMGKTARSMRDAADTVAASARRAGRTANNLYKDARSMRDTTTAKPRKLSREERERKFDSIQAEMMK